MNGRQIMQGLTWARRAHLVLALAAWAVIAWPCRAEIFSATHRVAMSDGVRLATDVHLPAKGKPPYPAILIRTPYGRSAGKGIADALCPQGYAVVAQDMRGRFDSEGQPAIIFGNEGLGGPHHDGHDTMRWIVSQPWSDGTIVSWGGSALGIVQNMAAPGAPAALKGQIVLVAFSDYYHQGAYQGGVWRRELLEGWLKSQKLEAVNLPTFLAHPTYDDFWQNLNAEAHASAVNAPGIFIGGWYDIFLQGTINSFVAIQAHGGPAARGKCFLVIGPTAHGAFGQKVDYPRAGAAPLGGGDQLKLLAHWTKGMKNGVEQFKPVHYYVMGDPREPGAPGNYWRAADAWPPPATATSFYFHADQSLSQESPASADHRQYRYDPQNPVPTIGGQNLFVGKGPMDQRPIEKRPDVLLFTSAPLAEPVEVTGRITAKLSIASDCPDTDFTVKLCDVDPEGRSSLVTDGIQRASLRTSDAKRELLEPGNVYDLSVDLWSTSLIFNRGHRIRVVVSSSNAPRFEPNANTGDPHPVPGKTRVATNTVYLSDKHPSQIVLPIYRAPTGSAQK